MDYEQYLFSWDEVPGNDEDRLKEFLKHNFCVYWIGTLQFVKSSDERTISISNESHPLSIKLNDENTKAILAVDGRKTYEFIVKSEDGKLNIYYECINLIQLIQCKEQILREYLDNLGEKRPWWQKPTQWMFPEDPVRIKNLEKVIGHLQSILFFLDSRSNAETEGTVSLISLLKQIKVPEKISFNNAWELADLIEIELIRHGDDAYLYMLLKAQDKLDTTHKWDKHFPADYLKTLLESYSRCKYLFSWDKISEKKEKDRLKEFLKNNFCVDWVETAEIKKSDDGRTILVSTEEKSLSLILNDKRTKVNLEIDDSITGKFTAEMENGTLNIYDDRDNFPDRYRLEARRFLEYIQQALVTDYRRDRAKAMLRGKYLGIIAVILSVFLAMLSVSFYLAVLLEGSLGSLLLVVLSAGAVGSVLSRAIKLSRQPLQTETETKTDETPLGIRALISWWKVFLAQPVIGATSALIIFLVFYSGMLQIVDVKTLNPAHYGLIAFLAGFSEAYFIGILDKVAGQSGGSLR